MKFSGKVAVVTGGSRGIGRAICKAFAENGADVAFLCRSLGEAAVQTQQELASFGGKVRGYACDVADYEAVKETFARILSDFGTVDILVNNAGITRDKLLLGMEPEDFTSVVDTDLISAFNTVRQAYPVMARKRAGRILNISSVSGVHGNAGQCNYAAAKSGLIGFSKSVAKELAARHVTCNVIAPGFVETDMTRNFQNNPELLKAIPLKRFAKPEEIAALALFLAGDEAGYITGQVIEISGGLFM